MNHYYETVKRNQTFLRPDGFYTDSKMVMYQKWLEKIAKGLKIKMKNLSHSGIKGIEKGSEKEIMALKANTISFSAVSRKIRSRVKKGSITMIEKLKVLKKDIEGLKRSPNRSRLEKVLTRDKMIFQLLEMVMYLDFLKLKRNMQDIDGPFLEKVIRGTEEIEELFRYLI